MLISLLVIPFSAGLNEITIDSTSNLQDQKKYTINGLQGSGSSSLDLSSLNFGPADLEFLATLFTLFPSFSAVMTKIDISKNNIGADVSVLVPVLVLQVVHRLFVNYPSTRYSYLSTYYGRTGSQYLASQVRVDLRCDNYGCS